MLYILETRSDPDNFFAPYYKLLPKDYRNFPIFWTNEMLSWLSGSTLVSDIRDRKATLRADYDELCRVSALFASTHSFEAFLEVRTAVGSRNFGIRIDGEKSTAMVPFADMLNHYRPRETSWTFDSMRDCFTITSIAPLSPGMLCIYIPI